MCLNITQLLKKPLSYPNIEVLNLCEPMYLHKTEHVNPLSYLNNEI